MKALLKTALAVALFTGATTTPALDAGTVAVGLDRAEAAIEGVIKNAAAEGNVLIFNAATEARLLLQAWRRENQALLDTAFDRLDTTTTTAFSKLESSLDRASRAGGEAAAAALDITEAAQQLVERSVWRSTQPIVTRLSPGYLVPGLDAPLRVRFDGINLDQPQAALRLPDGTLIKPVNVVQRSMSFDVPRTLRDAATGGNTHSVPLTLELTVPHSTWWRRWVGAQETLNYDFSLMQLPQQLATVTVRYGLASTRREERARQQQFFHKRGGRYRSATCDAVPIRPYDGWKIDPASLRRTYDTGAHGRFEIVGLTPEGFVGKSCAKSRSRSGYKDTIIAWTEFRDVPVVEETQDRTVERIGWLEDLAVRLPANAVDPELTVRVFDGRVFKISQSRDEGFIRASYDPQNKLFTLRPLAAQYSAEQRNAALAAQ